MKKVCKKIVAVTMGVLMFLFPAHSAFARIDVAEFSDGSRLTRFSREDLQNMVDRYNEYAIYAARSERTSRGYSPCFRSCLPYINYFFWILLGTGMFITIPYIGGDAPWGVIGIPILGVGTLGSIVFGSPLCCDWKCCLMEDSSNTYPWSKNQIDEIKAWLIRQNVLAGAGESQPLLQGGVQDVPNYFLLFERPRNKVNVAPLPFFTTDRDTHFAQSFRDSKFAGLIRDVGGKLRAQGARVSDRYCLTRVGNEFHQARNVPIMPEIDSVEVVVD